MQIFNKIEYKCVINANIRLFCMQKFKLQHDNNMKKRAKKQTSYGYGISQEK